MYKTLIKTKELAGHLDDKDWVIVDCRFSLADTEAGRRAYKESHIPGAFYAHLDDDLSGEIVKGKTGRHPLPEVDDLVNTFSQWGIGPGTQVVAYDDMSGAIAARLWWMLQWLGHEAVAVLDGGWPKWKKEGRPVSAEPPRPSPKKFNPRIREELLVDAEFVDRIRKAPDFRLVDSRTPERYRGEEDPIDPVAGHIPGAVNAPHTENVREAGDWLSPQELRHHFEEILEDVEPGKAVFYCGSGVTACRNILAVKHAGLGDAKLYAGSWSEWITNEERAVEKG
jgi:thiosulfate/3-mercaptopyruvate sulfurtransferase